MNVALTSFIDPRTKQAQKLTENIASDNAFKYAVKNGLNHITLAPGNTNAVTVVNKDGSKTIIISKDIRTTPDVRLFFEEIAHANQSLPKEEFSPLEKSIARRLFLEISAKSIANVKVGETKYGAALKDIASKTKEKDYEGAINIAIEFLKSKGHSNIAINQLLERIVLDIEGAATDGSQTYFNNSDTPQGYHTKDDVSKWLGFTTYSDPEQLWTNVANGVSANYNDVKIVQAPNGKFIIKPSTKAALSIDFADVFETMPRVDMLMRSLIRTLYTDVFEVPEGKLFLSNDKVPFTASVYLPNLHEDLTLYQSGEESHRVPLSIIHLVFGLEDLAPNNYLRAESGKPAIIDCDMIKFDIIQTANISRAQTLIATNYAPFIMSNGGNDLKPYLVEYQKIKDLINNNPAILEQVMDSCGLKEDEKSTYWNTLREDIELYEKNISTYVAIANGTLPEHMLNKISWHSNPEPRIKEEIINPLVINLNNKGDEALIQIGDCGYLHILKDKADITLQTYFDDDISQKTISNGVFVLGNGSEGNTDFVIEESSIAPKHLQIEVISGKKVKLTRLDPEFIVQLLS